MRCLLCNSERLTMTHMPKRQQIIEKWHESYGIDITKELPDETITKWVCANCEFSFCDPIFAGSDWLYAQLQELDFYYMRDKWEYYEALKHITPKARVLEVGCGEGAFLERIRGECEGITGQGLELNVHAVEVARRKGLQVSPANITEYARQNAGSFDCVLMFQVLEHVIKVNEFLHDAISLLKTDGRLIFSVPNNAGFIKLDKNDLLNMPPHHINFFCPSAISAMPKYFPLNLETLCYEPLAKYHVDWYSVLFARRYLKISWRLYHCIYRLVNIMLMNRSVRMCVRGHTVLAVFRKGIRAE